MAFLLANWALRLITLAIKLLRRGGGTSFPGSMALKIDKNILVKFSSQLPRRVIIVTGTNGKTSVATLLAGVLREAGFKVVHNSSGANLLGGVTVAFSQSANIFGRLNHDWAVIEADEGVFASLVAQLKPKAVLVTNIFADQLDRYGDTEKALALIAQGLANLPAGSQVILNGDDPLLTTLSPGPEIDFKYFCLKDSQKSLGEIHQFCPSCRNKLSYHQLYYENLGKFECANCGFKNPACNYWAEDIELQGLKGSEFTLASSRDRFDLNINTPGLYNIYNYLGVFALASDLQMPIKTIETSLNDFQGSFGRMQRIEIAGKKAIMALAKNAAGFNQVLNTLKNKEEYRLLLGVNDQLSDGIDLSWLWDINFEDLLSDSLNLPVHLSGSRALDLKLRLKYAQIDQVLVEEDLSHAFALAIADLDPKEELIIIINYTAMLQLQNSLSKKGLIKPFWQGDQS